jgi:hypothetical protein
MLVHQRVYFKTVIHAVARSPGAAASWATATENTRRAAALTRGASRNGARNGGGTASNIAMENHHF